MAEELTIDTSKLTRTAVQFGKGMNAFLDTEMEYIEYLRNRGGIMGVGSGAGNTKNQLQLDYAKKWHHPDFGWGVGLPYRPRNIKPQRGFWQNKLNKFNQTRMQRKIYNHLRNKFNLKPNQIEVYKRLKNLGYNHTKALEGARNTKPTGNWLTNVWSDYKKGFQRPDWMTRKNWGPLRPGVRDRVGDFFTKQKMGVGNNKTLQPRNLPGFLKGLKGIFSMKNINNALAGIGFTLDLRDRISNQGQEWWKAIVGAGASTWCAVKAGGAMATKFAAWGSALGPWGAGIAGLAGGIIGATLGGALCGGAADIVTGANDTTEKKKFGGLVQGVAQCTDCASTSKHSDGAVITSPTRGILGGTKALVGEANEAELIIPMSKIGDAISAVYREGASIMVGATLAFLGPLAGGPAVASLLSEAKRIGELVGADKDIKVSTIELPEALPALHTNKVNNKKEDVKGDTEFTSNKTQTEGSGSTTNTSSTTITGTKRWKTILPQGDPLFSSPFGMRWGRMHRGIDIGVWENSPVHAQEGGVVEQIIPKFGEYGGAVVIAHQDGTANLYGHVHDYVVTPGQKVEKGDPLAKIIYYPGKDGSNQSHLHFERFNKSGTRIDPLPYFQQGGASIDSQTNGTVDAVNQGGPINTGRNILSSFVNIGSTVFNQNKQELIDTPVNTTNVGNRSNTLIPVPVPVPVPVPINKYITVPDETKNETKMVIDVFGKGASRS